MLAASAVGAVAATTARAAEFGNPDQPPQGAINATNPASLTDPGPQSMAIASQFPSAQLPPPTDVGSLPLFWASFNNAPRRIQDGGWARQVTQADFAISETIAGVNMRLTAGGIRELHWHLAAEWAYVTYGHCRITLLTDQGQAYVADVKAGDVWYFPPGFPHSLQGLGPDGCEFVICFDDGAAGEFNTLLLTEWLAHTPPAILADSFGVPPETFARIPLNSLYIFQGELPGELAADRAAVEGANGFPPQPFTFPLAGMAPTRQTRGGETRVVDSRNFPVSTTIAAALVTLRPGALRDLHWHPNADEWQYWIKGQGRMTVFNTGPKARDDGLQPGRRRLRQAPDRALRQQRRRHRSAVSRGVPQLLLRRHLAHRLAQPHAARPGRPTPQDRPRDDRALPARAPRNHAGMRTLRLGLIGHGAIGRAVVAAARSGELGPASALVGVLVRRPRAPGDDPLLTHDPERFFGLRPDAVLECAGHQAVRDHGARCLEAGADLVLTSIGALVDDDLHAALRSAAQTAGRRLIIASAGIGALDILAAAATGGLERVVVTVRKDPSAWSGTAAESVCNLATLAAPLTLFDGSVREGAALYPQNVNISAAAALAGLGLDRTRLVIVVDPALRRHVVEIEAEGAFGRFSFAEEVEPTAENPKTGKLVAMAVIKTVRQLAAPEVIGA